MLNPSFGSFTIKVDLDFHTLEQLEEYATEGLTVDSTHTIDPPLHALSLEPTHAQNFLHSREVRTNDFLITHPELTDKVERFALIIDAKSPYTAEHSAGVARLSGFLAKKAGLDNIDCSKIEIAGLLHDLGKLNVPNSILEKRAKLDSDEMFFMRHHSYASFDILHTIKGLEDIAIWAANHHESLDGSGYPFHKTADEIDFESRIIAVSDIFQAMTQDRPYRYGLSQENIIKHLKQEVAQGKLDNVVVSIVEKHQDSCYQLSTTQP